MLSPNNRKRGVWPQVVMGYRYHAVACQVCSSAGLATDNTRACRCGEEVRLDPLVDRLMTYTCC